MKENLGIKISFSLDTINIIRNVCRNFNNFLLEKING